MSVPEIEIELRSLRVMARIGVTDAELEAERPLLLDIDLIPIPVATAAAESDRIEDTVDYAEVAAIAERLAAGDSHRTLERLAARIADELLAATRCERVSVRVAKPDPPMDQRVDQVAVRVARGALR